VQSTGNVSEAQKLAGVAMDASAGSGKSLKVVSEAIAKAHNGNLGALSRLGVKIKDTDGKTLSFNDAMKEMGKTFKGQAAAGANTFDGKMGRLKLMFDETKETIGQALIPMLTKLADWFLKLVKGMQNGTGAGGDLRDVFNKIGDVVKKVGPVLTGVFKFLVDNKAAVGAFIAVLGGFKILKSIRDGFIALNLAMEANPIGLVVVAIAALAAGLVYAYKHSETFRNIVNGVFHAVASAASHMWNDVIKPVFKFLINTWLTVAGASSTVLPEHSAGCPALVPS
jgi:phage-related protein